MDEGDVGLRAAVVNSLELRPESPKQPWIAMARSHILLALVRRQGGRRSELWRWVSSDGWRFGGRRKRTENEKGDAFMDGGRGESILELEEMQRWF
ncbi:hypothetical protein PanWU01x14_286110 [Parasponia andersonii]|uniref:Uncharacterized protein n=1 Tax=Parasponia andersonii TaxID=3476 RepID=A0A2P5AZ79_PARAD|nr:hypothetical protein PanWU01x14_286110 [Parasponia andersonii]